MEISALATPVDGDLPNQIHLYTFPDINPKNMGLCSFVDNSLKGQFKLWAQGVNLTAVMIFLLLIVRGQKQTCLLRFYSWCSSFIISKNVFFFFDPRNSTQQQQPSDSSLLSAAGPTDQSSTLLWREKSRVGCTQSQHKYCSIILYSII